MTAKRKHWVTALIGAGVLLLVLLGALLLHHSANKTPCLSIVAPSKVSLSGNREVVVDVTVSDLGAALYPAASASILFDPSRLEFLGVQEGNVFVRDSELGQTLPEWSCNPAQCNKIGQINVMYLDLTGGANAFERQLLADEGNVLMRLAFRLRGSARAGDVYELTVEDAVFAASNEKESLAMLPGTLIVRNGRIAVEDGI